MDKLVVAGLTLFGKLTIGGGRRTGGKLGKEFVAGEWGQTLGRSVVAMVPESGLGSKVTEGGLV